MSANDYGLADRIGYRSLAKSAQLYAPLIVLQPSQVEIGEHTRIDSFVKIEGGMSVKIGRYVHISSFVHLNIGGGWLEIGDYVAITSGARILSGSNTRAGISMSSAAPQQLQIVERGKTVIGKYAFVGSGATVLPGVSLGVGAVLGAGGVATHSIPDGEIWMGIPARKVSERDWQSQWGERAS